MQAGGQAIVGAVTQGGEGATSKVRIEPMHRQPLPMHLSPRCGARTARAACAAGSEGQETMPEQGQKVVVDLIQDRLAIPGWLASASR